MTPVRALSLALALVAVATPAWAAQDDEHRAHHPAGAVAAPTPKAMSGKSGSDMARMDAQMKVMREMHDKMMTAQTPEARNALMADHVKVMREGMTMMNGMSPGAAGGMKGDMGAHHQMLERRMDMMQSMMQMMMDRLPAAPAN